MSLLDQVFAAGERLFEQFTWRRAMFLSSTMVVALVGVIAFEWMTGTFRLARLKSEIDVVGQIHELRRDPTLRHPLVGVVDQLERNLIDEVASRPVPPTLQVVDARFWAKFAAGSAFFLFLAASRLHWALKARKEPDRWRSSASGWRWIAISLVLAGIMGWIDTALPERAWPLSNLVWFPLAQVVVVMGWSILSMGSNDVVVVDSPESQSGPTAAGKD